MAPPTNIPCWHALSSNWTIAAVAGIIAVVALGLWHRYFDRTASRRYLLIFLGFTVAMAGLFAWHNRHREAVRTTNIATLREFDAEANRLLEAGLSVSDANEYAAYRATADRFFGRLERWVADNMGPRSSEIVTRHDPKDVNIVFESAIDKDHAAAVTAIVQARENITALIDAHALDKCVKPTPAEHPIPRDAD